MSGRNAAMMAAFENDDGCDDNSDDDNCVKIGAGDIVAPPHQTQDNMSSFTDLLDHYIERRVGGGGGMPLTGIVLVEGKYDDDMYDAEPLVATGGAPYDEPEFYERGYPEYVDEQYVSSGASGGGYFDEMAQRQNAVLADRPVQLIGFHTGGAADDDVDPDVAASAARYAAAEDGQYAAAAEDEADDVEASTERYDRAERALRKPTKAASTKGRRPIKNAAAAQPDDSPVYNGGLEDISALMLGVSA